MSFDYKPVSLEEYNQSLKDSVNAYYTHTINDPSTSREDALKSTGEMAEKFFEAVEEFQNAEVENTESVQTTTEVNTGNVTLGSNESGVDEGADENSSVNNDEPDGGEECDDGMDP